LLKRLSKRREVSSIVALVAPRRGQPAQVFARHFRGSVHGGQVVVALRHFRRKVGHPLVVVWDRLQAHRSKEVRRFLDAHPEDFHVEWLPAYSPEVNPEEQCNAFVKKSMLNAAPSSVEELHRMVRGRFTRLQHRPDMLRRFFEHAGLPVNRTT
jgi:transposase